MYTIIKPKPSKLTGIIAYISETLETRINRIVNNKEPIQDSTPIIYTERKDGVKPEYDIRTDRFEIALDAMDAIARTKTGQREQSIGERTYDTMSEEKQKEFNKKYPGNKHAKKASENKPGPNPGPEKGGA